MIALLYYGLLDLGFQGHIGTLGEMVGVGLLSWNRGRTEHVHRWTGENYSPKQKFSTRRPPIRTMI